MRVKYALTCVTLLAFAAGAYAQGTVIANNAAASAIFTPGGTVKATSTTPIWIGLFYSTDLAAAPDPVRGDSWLLSAPPVSIGPIAGIFAMGTRTLPNTATAQNVLFQVRIWDKAFENTAAGYLQCVNSGDTTKIFGFQTGGNNSANIPGTMLLALGGGSVSPKAITTDGLFNGVVGQFVPVIPEPSILALSLLGGLGTLVLIRRRK